VGAGVTGIILGKPEGPSEGLNDGAKVTVGPKVGLGVGEGDGTRLGADEGLIVGPGVGFGVGGIVGPGVGGGVGPGVGFGVGGGVGDLVGGGVGGLVGGRGVGGGVGFGVGGGVGDLVGGGVGRFVGDRGVGGEVGGGVGFGVGGLVGGGVGGLVGAAIGTPSVIPYTDRHGSDPRLLASRRSLTRTKGGAPSPLLGFIFVTVTIMTALNPLSNILLLYPLTHVLQLPTLRARLIMSFFDESSKRYPRV